MVLLAVLFGAAARPDPSEDGRPVPVQVFALRRSRRRRSGGRCRWLVSRARRRRLVRARRIGVDWWTARVLDDLTRIAAVGVLSVATGAGPWPVSAVLVVLGLWHAILVVGRATASVRLLRWLPALDRLTRRVVVVLLLGCLLSALETAGQSHCAAAVGMLAPSARWRLARVEVEGDRVRIVIDGPTVLELPLVTPEDERVAMVLCRHLKDREGRPVLRYQAIADAFGKNSRQCCQNHMQDLARAGGSIAEMVRTALGAHPPPAVHPEVQALVARHWERDPLASIEETCRWLASRELSPDVPLPSPERLRATQHIQGNLVVARNTVRRLLERRGDGLALALPRLHRQLLEVVDEQDRRLRAAGVEPAPLPGAVEVAAGLTRKTPARLSTSGRALMTALRALVSSPSAEQDEALAAAVGAKHLAPLHWGLLYCTLQISVGQVGALVDRSKSVIYRGLVRLAHSVDLLDPFPAAARFSGVLALDEKWVKIPKSFSKGDRAEGKKWRYVHFAMDALTGDLLHIDVFEVTDADSIRAFLAAVRAKGIRPKVVVTDMLAAYDGAIRDTFGDKVLHHFCLFHHLQAVRHRLRERCGKDWSSRPLLRQLVDGVDEVYRCRTRTTARRRLAKVLALRDELARHHPEALSVLDTIERRFPMVANALGRSDVPRTNNITERAIRAFARHYKNMAGFESLDTARLQVALFRFFYRLTPMREAKRPEHRGLCPLERAGWCLRGVPVADYVRRFTAAWDEEGPDLLLASAAPRAGPPPSSDPEHSLAAAA